MDIHFSNPKLSRRPLNNGDSDYVMQRKGEMSEAAATTALIAIGVTKMLNIRAGIYSSCTR